ncbi:MAG: hypothetical protein EBT09_00365 [Actinobacteria bacterium]|nr:hypothetical protein [Actinomycetota bacterium]
MAPWTPFGTDWQQGTMVAGKPVSTAGYATYVRDNMQYLKDVLAGGGAIITFASPSVAFAALASPAAGTATTVVRSDHLHQTPATWPIEFRQAGTSKGFRATLNIVGGAIVEDDAANARINITPVNVAYAYAITSATSRVTDNWTAGSGTTVARVDHVHQREGWSSTVTTLVPGGEASQGDAANDGLARADHSHTMPTRWPIATYVNGTLVGIRSLLNVIAGSGVTVSQAYDSATTSNNLTITATGTPLNMQVQANGGTVVSPSRTTLNFVTTGAVTATNVDDPAASKLSIGATSSTLPATVVPMPIKYTPPSLTVTATSLNYIFNVTYVSGDRTTQIYPGMAVYEGTSAAGTWRGVITDVPRTVGDQRRTGNYQIWPALNYSTPVTYFLVAEGASRGAVTGTCTKQGTTLTVLLITSGNNLVVGSVVTPTDSNAMIITGLGNGNTGQGGIGNYTVQPYPLGNGSVNLASSTVFSAAYTANPNFPGVSARYARQDHEHDFQGFDSGATGVDANATQITANATGSAGTGIIANANHIHAVPTAWPVRILASGGTAPTLRSSLNFISGTGIDITAADNATNSLTAVTIAANAALGTEGMSLLYSGTVGTLTGGATFGEPLFTNISQAFRHLLIRWKAAAWNDPGVTGAVALTTETSIVMFPLERSDAATPSRSDTITQSWFQQSFIVNGNAATYYQPSWPTKNYAAPLGRITGNQGTGTPNKYGTGWALIYNYSEGYGTSLRNSSGIGGTVKIQKYYESQYSWYTGSATTISTSGYSVGRGHGAVTTGQTGYDTGALTSFYLTGGNTGQPLHASSYIEVWGVM